VTAAVVVTVILPLLAVARSALRRTTAMPAVSADALVAAETEPEAVVEEKPAPPKPKFAPRARTAASPVTQKPRPSKPRATTSRPAAVKPRAQKPPAQKPPARKPRPKPPAPEGDADA
jgi:hypothetical protein